MVAFADEEAPPQQWYQRWQVKLPNIFWTIEIGRELLYVEL
jgi:hypothetical protein